MASRPLLSLRVWLQSTSLLAVLAGYSCLFAISSGFAEAERLDRHKQLIVSITQGLQSGSLQLPLPAGFGVEALQVDSSDASPPNQRSAADGSIWLVSRSSTSSQTQAGVLEVRQNITASVQRQHRSQLLLVAAAGVSALFTSLLLRIVLWRGLIQPLRGLTRELSALSADSLGQRTLDPVGQSQELQPIVQAFNNLQQRLASAWQRERSFVDGVAHELRTPITVISSHAQSLQRDAEVPSRSALKLIAQETQRMAALITVMLDFARGDSGRLRLDIQSLDPEVLLLDAYERLQLINPQRLCLAAANNNCLGLVHADQERVQQCLAALVENAMQYSDGEVELAVDDLDHSAVLHVRDRGPGIAEDERAQVVERFARGSASIGKRGSGIGLATVTMLMQAMGGELVIGDVPGGGADMQLRFKISGRQPLP